MQIKIFTIPVIADQRDLDELNHFLRANRVIDIRRELTQTNGNCFWSFCITYMPFDKDGETDKNSFVSRQLKVDYKEKLDADAFERFAKLRKLRKDIADSEAVPAYAVFTDAELAGIAQLEVLDTANMLKIPGIGKKKVEKYGEAFCHFDTTISDNEKSRPTNATDSQP